MKETRKKLHMSLKRSTIVVTVIIAVLCTLLAANTWTILDYIGQSVDLSEAHIKYTDIASQFSLGSDILTENARLFAETGDVRYIYAYFQEVRVVRHRDKALKELENIHMPLGNEKANAAMAESVALMERECYSMKLAAIGHGTIFDAIERSFEQLGNVVLTPEDAMLTPEEAKQKARSMLVDVEYSNSKQLIKTNLDLFLSEMVSASRLEYEKITEKLDKKLSTQTILIALIIISLFALAVFVIRFIINPIVRASDSIKKDMPITMPRFFDEMNSLNESYNSLRGYNTDLMNKLNQIATKDILTDLGNRFSYNNYCGELFKKDVALLLFLFDINDLHGVNNNEGHSAGDKLIMDTAKCILNVFGRKNEENCFRIGGDEFVAFIEEEPEEDAGKYKDAFRKECEKCGISVSVGHSYTGLASAANLKDMFNSADEMMYEDKIAYGRKSK